ncbi:hypothetical protein [Actinomadura decatromicini]|uniref:hypothetical protein n=1 Tax=Actinomadura decatromicini TaxID=2604572 RepID=UPI0016533EB1|nr:hypothetical protein [Actinomadura decatromicini]
MQNWLEMDATAFRTLDEFATQLGLFAQDGDEFGDYDVFTAIREAEEEAAAARRAAEEAAPVVAMPERTDGALFGLTVSEVPADGALFSVVAA